MRSHKKRHENSRRREREGLPVQSLTPFSCHSRLLSYQILSLKDIVILYMRHGLDWQIVGRTCRDTSLLLLQLCALQVRLGGGFSNVGLDSLPLLWSGECVQQRVFGRDDHVCGPEEGVGPGGEDLQ